MSVPKIKVLVGDGHRLLAESLGIALARCEDLEVAEAWPTTGTAVLAEVVSQKPGVLLLDYWIPGSQATAMVQQIREWAPGLKIIFMSWLHGPDQIQAALDSGAVGFLPKSVSVARVAEAVRRADGGETPVFAEELGRLVEELGRRCREQEVRVERLLRLTSREVTILQALSVGGPVRDVARTLSVTPSTLRTHIHRILQKTGARSQLEAVAMARKEGLVRD